jgi:EAL domain-containing protein (putative c-di-GMP-specific phosphodiesterase class I)
MERKIVQAGYETFTASTAAEAARLAARRPLDLAVAAGLDALETLRSLREIQPGCLRIIATMRPDDPDVISALNRGDAMHVVPADAEIVALGRGIETALATGRRMHGMAQAQRAAAAAHEGEVLETCLDQRLMDLAIQPIHCANTQQTFGWECLLRPRHHVFDTPLAMIRGAERHGRVDRLGREVFSLATAWLPRLPDSAQLFVNVHPHQLRNAAYLREALAPLVPDARRITLELPEYADFTDSEESIALLHDLGFELALDDVSGGGDTINRIAELAPSYLKLDVSLVRHIDQDAKKRRIVEILAGVARNSGAQLVAECVETAAEAEAVTHSGATLLQGYFFGRPTTELAAKDQKPSPETGSKSSLLSH